MNINEAYKVFTILRLHFTTDNYDIRSGIAPKTPKNGVRKNLHAAIEKILKRYNYNNEEYMGYLISNFINGDNWGGLFSPEGEEMYNQWRKTQDSLTYTFKQEMETISHQFETIEQLWDCKQGHPPILKLYYGKKCHLETLVILNKLYRFRDIINNQISLDPVWETINRLLFKYSPFIKIDKEKFYMIANQVFV